MLGSIGISIGSSCPGMVHRSCSKRWVIERTRILGPASHAQAPAPSPGPTPSADDWPTMPTAVAHTGGAATHDSGARAHRGRSHSRCIVHSGVTSFSLQLR